MRGALAIVIEPEDPPHDLMRAAGGVICRDGDSGAFEIAVIHRPHREDWSFPKGKLDPGESFEQCAVRETYEETGLYCELDRFVGVTEYTHRKGRPKIVAYWLMGIIGGTFTVNPEADEIRWLSIDEARQLVTYDRDRELLDLVAAVLSAESAA
jgi:8-oxo-dGTP pyrophosphatase MutT (NUDIX family)